MAVRNTCVALQSLQKFVEMRVICIIKLRVVSQSGNNPKIYLGFGRVRALRSVGSNLESVFGNPGSVYRINL